MKVTVLVNQETNKISILVSDDEDQTIDIELTKDSARKLSDCILDALRELDN